MSGTLLAVHPSHSYAHIGDGRRRSNRDNSETACNTELADKHGGYHPGSVGDTRWRAERVRNESRIGAKHRVHVSPCNIHKIVDGKQRIVEREQKRRRLYT
jgi:hypothetical protein